MNWILFGFKGAGKTYFGKRLGLPFLDTDQLIEKQAGCSVRALNPAYFRKLEKAIVYSLNVTGHVIAVGGSTVFDEQSLKYLQTLGKMLYLQCPKALLKRRLLTPPLPTFLDPKDPEGSFERMYCTRIPKYEKIPSYPIDCEGKTDQEVLEALWQVINLDKSFESPLGENPTEKPLASSSTDAPQVS